MEFSGMLNQVVNGDCLEVMAGIPDESVGLVVTSPPYDLLNSTGHGFSSRPSGKWRSSAFQGGKGYDLYSDSIPEDRYQDWLYAVMREVLRVLKPDGAAFVVFKERVQGGHRQDRAWVWAQLPVRQTIIWARPGGYNHNRSYFTPTHEYIHLVAQRDFKLRKGAGGCGTVWYMQPARDNPHPAPFPLELASRCIESTPDNGPVLDPFLGSGTTAVAAVLAGRDWIGIDISEEYCGWAREWVALAGS